MICLSTMFHWLRIDGFMFDAKHTSSIIEDNMDAPKGNGLTYRDSSPIGAG